ncbi:MAG: hypothetical protein P9M00_08675 [Candidatus Tritonobacter lacicola]|nr:hypothetical protein [Candidatus Tritonobacter lacicola]
MAHKKNILVLLFIFLYCFGCSTNKNGYLKYPGNGIPLISKDMEVEKLQEELKECSSHYKNICFNENRFEFVDISDFSFQLSKEIIDKEWLMLEVNLRIFTGECRISIGNLSYIIKKQSIRVFDDGKEIYANYNNFVKSIYYQKVPTSTSTILCFTGSPYSKILDAKIDMPAIIKIELTYNCSGYIGPWVWVRGAK